MFFSLHYFLSGLGSPRRSASGSNPGSASKLTSDDNAITCTRDSTTANTTDRGASCSAIPPSGGGSANRAPTKPCSSSPGTEAGGDISGRKVELSSKKKLDEKDYVVIEDEPGPSVTDFRSMSFYGSE